jgi:hypothetical protein
VAVLSFTATNVRLQASVLDDHAASLAVPWALAATTWGAMFVALAEVGRHAKRIGPPVAPIRHEPS